MFYAIALIPKDIGEGCFIRSLKTNGYKTQQAAQNALIKANVTGFVKKLGNVQPVWWKE